MAHTLKRTYQRPFQLIDGLTGALILLASAALRQNPKNDWMIFLHTSKNNGCIYPA